MALRALARAGRLLGVVAGGLAVAAWLACRPRTDVARRQRWTQWFLGRLARALPLTIQVHGRCAPGPALWVCNHVSWVDIAVLGSLAPLSFLSKADVRDWPVAGWLAHQAGTLFIRRGAGDGMRTNQQLAERLRAGHSLVIFPEGTTTDGQQLRTFHPRLLACAIDTGTPVQPVAIRYRRDGAPDPLTPFIGDDDLLSHLRRLLAADRAIVEVHLLPPIRSTGLDRGTLAAQAQAAVATVLFGVIATQRDAA